MVAREGSDSNKTTRYITPTGKVPLLSAVDDEVDWTMVAIELRAFLKRFEGYEEALFETQLEDVNARAEQKRRLGKNNALNIVYSYLVEMCTPNKTAMLQVREHATTDVDFYANNLWKMLETRFTQERMNKIQGYLNEIGRVKHEANEDFKTFIDRFKKLIGDVRSIDPKQVPTDVNLMGVLKEALSENEFLWGHLTIAKNISLEEMMDTVVKWKSKTQKAQISTDSAVANYSAMPGYLKKAAAKKQRSGRASGQDNFADREETRACLACKKVGHLVKDCRDRSAKESWLSKREKMNYSEQDHDKSRDRKHDRQSRERSRSTERSHSRDRSDGRERENYKKSKSVKSNNNWMNSNGEDLSGSEDSEEE